MRKHYLVLWLLATSLGATAQQKPNTYEKQQVSQTDVQVLFSYYNQDGIHSAVTAGSGTEKLAVYAPSLTITHRSDSQHTFSLNGGVDIISSASTDNIDFNRSSASSLDARTHMVAGYAKTLGQTGYTVGINGGFSIESDYFSLGTGLSVSQVDPTGQREISVKAQANFDDLRWGRLEVGSWSPQKLIYPAELRTQEWFDEYRRRSYNLNVGIYQIVNKRMALGVYPGIMYQTGLLSTPFHRVIFSNGNVGVERLPQERIKVPIGVQLNTFLGRMTILRAYYRYYWDDFGIQAHTLSLTAPVKISPKLTIGPALRGYTQRGSIYFQPIAVHDEGDTYYTSDYDLSTFTSYQVGMDFRFASLHPATQKGAFQSIGLSYRYYKRSDGLYYHTFSLLLDFGFEKIKPPK